MPVWLPNTLPNTLPAIRLPRQVLTEAEGMLGVSLHSPYTPPRDSHGRQPLPPTLHYGCSHHTVVRSLHEGPHRGLEL